jgi:hypothetical protein
MNDVVEQEDATVCLPMKTEKTLLNGGAVKTSPSTCSLKNPTALPKFQFISTRQMDRSDLLSYIKELETYIKTYEVQDE